MEELLVGSLLVWAIGRIAKKKADKPAPGTITQERTMQTTDVNEPSGFQRARPWR